MVGTSAVESTKSRCPSLVFQFLLYPSAEAQAYI